MSPTLAALLCHRSLWIGSKHCRLHLALQIFFDSLPPRASKERRRIGCPTTQYTEGASPFAGDRGQPRRQAWWDTVRKMRSKIKTTEDVATGTGGQGTPGRNVDGVADKVNRTVAKEVRNAD